MPRFEHAVIPDDLYVDSFTEFVKDVEPRLRRALSVALGIQTGAEATAHALAYGWEHWNRIQAMDNAAGYLYRVARSRTRPRRKSRPIFPAVPSEQAPWVEPGLPAALGRLTESQRTAVWLIHGFEWALDETAQLLNISVSSVRKHLARGERKLRNSLGVTL